MLKSLNPRAGVALAVVAASLFLLLCFTGYGPAEAADVNVLENAGWTAHLAAWFLDLAGAGAYVLVVLPLIWATVVYFREDTPDLVLRGTGTVMLAGSTAAIVGLLHAGEPQFWAGTFGSAFSGWVVGLADVFGSALAHTLGWTVSVVFFAISLVLATDWLFHTVRRGESPEAPALEDAVQTEHADYRLLDKFDEAEPRGFVLEETAAVRAAQALEERVMVDEPAPEQETIPQGWSAQSESGRTVLRAPAGYQGVEFLPPSDELAAPSQAIELPPDDVADEVVPQEAVEAAASEFEYEPLREEPAQAGIDQPLDGEPEHARAQLAEDAVPSGSDDVSATVATTLGSIGWPEPDSNEIEDEMISVDAMYASTDGPSEMRGEGPSAVSEFQSAHAPPPREPAPPDVYDPPLPLDQAWETEEMFPDADDTDDVDESVPVARGMVADDFLFADVAVHSEPEPEPPAAERTDESMPINTNLLIDDFVFTEQALHVEDDLIETPESLGAPGAEAARGQVSAPSPEHEHEHEPEPASEPEQMELPDTRTWDTAGIAVSANLARLLEMELDPLFRESVDEVLTRGRASAVVLQRGLGIGYGRANRILDQMTEVGLAGPDTPSGARAIKINSDDWERFVGAEG